MQPPYTNQTHSYKCSTNQIHSLSPPHAFTLLPSSSRWQPGKGRTLLVGGALEEELPRGTIRYSSRIVSIEEDGNLKVLHLALYRRRRAVVQEQYICRC